MDMPTDHGMLAYAVLYFLKIILSPTYASELKEKHQRFNHQRFGDPNQNNYVLP